MSPNTANSLVHDLVEMAKAMDILPQVQADNERLEKALDEALRTVQDREIAIFNNKAEIAELNNKVRSLEVERDDASFRVLEAEDREHVAVAMARSIASAVGNVINTLDPPKPEPELQPQAVPTATDQGSSEHLPSGSIATETTGSTADATTHSVNTSEPVDTLASEEAPKSYANPTVAPAYSPTTENVPMQATSTDVSNSESATSDSHEGPYFNKRYHDMPSYIPRWEWIEGGGAEADYDWRPSYSQNG